MSPNATPKLTEQELTCVKLAAQIQRRAWWRGLTLGLLPRIPWHPSFDPLNVPTKALLYFAMFLLCPIWLTGWLLQLLMQIILLPYRMLSTLFILRTIIPPGERNIQGMHRATQPYLDLSVNQYVVLVNQWVEVLYGPRAKRIHTLQYYLDTQLIDRKELSRVSYQSLDPYLRNHIGAAREKLSRALGYY